jgi:hypothetical protein
LSPFRWGNIHVATTRAALRRCRYSRHADDDDDDDDDEEPKACG